MVFTISIIPLLIFLSHQFDPNFYAFLSSISVPFKTSSFISTSMNLQHDYYSILAIQLVLTHWLPWPQVDNLI